VDYTRALEVDPANSFAYYNRGITKDRMGDFEGAVADFSSAIALDPKNADFYHNRGFSLRKQVGTWCNSTCGKSGEVHFLQR
jgi:Flp pilus assembly protein TadD